MKRNQTDFVILGLLSIAPDQSGYSMRKTIQESVGYFWGESFGQIYPALKRLVAAGLIVPKRSGSKDRERQGYSLTRAGRARLTEWLAVPYRADPPRDEFLLKLFFGREAAPSVSIGHVRAFQEKHRQLLATLLELDRIAHERGSANPHFPFWMLTLTYGIAQIRSALEWSESALAMLTSTKRNI